MMQMNERRLCFLLVALFTVRANGDEPIVWPGKTWTEASPDAVGLDTEQLQRARDYAQSQDGSGMIVRGGKVVMTWGDQDKRYDIKSATKSIGATALGIAIKDKKLSLRDLAAKRHPKFGVPPESNRRTGWIDDVTILHLATQTAGFAKPGGYEPLLFQPGTKWLYSDGGPNWLAECVTLAYRRDIEELMFERVFGPLGIQRDDLRWRDHAYRSKEIDGITRREFGSGVHANVDALARIGYVYLRNGMWKGEEILASNFIDMATRPVDSVVGLPEHEDNHGNASDQYGMLWWTNADRTLAKVPDDAYWAWGLYDSLIVVMPSLDLVVVRAGARGKSWPRKDGENHYDVLAPFLEPIVLACGKAHTTSKAPYSPSNVITSIEWAPKRSIIRKAPGGDNWPITWGDDDRLYTAYGDGYGFKPQVERKLSLGLAIVEGGPDHFFGKNLRSHIEQIGQGPDGKKASGMLMAKGDLFMFVRNADNSQLAWSTDRGVTWKWADWKFEHSFGCPTLLNCGRNYEDAPDEFVYIYSHDSDSAYEPADRMVLARVPINQIKQQDEYEFFVRLDSDAQPVWSERISDRGAVFEHQSRCYRSGISYNAALERYLWVQIIPDLDGEKAATRFDGGFGIYDAPNPWGPWTTVFFTERWDVGPGETASFPTKWISADGRTLHLAFSGDDHFSVRRAVLQVSSDAN